MPVRFQVRLPGPFVWQRSRRPRRRRRNTWPLLLGVLAVMLAVGALLGVRGYWELLPAVVGGWLLFVLRNPPGTST